MDILIPLDAAPHSQLCVDLVLNLFALAGVRIYLLHVVVSPDPAILLADATGQLEQAYSQGSKQITTELLEQVTQSLRAAGADTIVKVVEGDPAVTITSFVESQRLEVIVTAPGTHTPREKMLYGTITSNFLRHDFQGTLLLARKIETNDKPPPAVFVIDGAVESLEAIEQFGKALSPSVPIIPLASRAGFQHGRKPANENGEQDKKPSVEHTANQAVERLRQLGRDSQPVLTDKPVDRWVKEFTDHDPLGLLVLARTRAEFLHRPVTGSPKEQLFLSATCPTALYCSRSTL